MGLEFWLVKDDPPEAYVLGKGFWCTIFSEGPFVMEDYFADLGEFCTEVTGLLWDFPEEFTVSVAEDIWAWCDGSKVNCLNESDHGWELFTDPGYAENVTGTRLKE